jgi:hypothetical protein
MFRHIGNQHTHATFALVYDQTSALEHSLYILVSCIEILESNKVAEQTLEIAIYIKELVNHVNTIGRLFKRKILCHEVE